MYVWNSLQRNSIITEHFFFFSLSIARSYVPRFRGMDVLRSLRGRNDGKKAGGGGAGGGKTARQCRQLEKRRNSWSVSDIIVVGVSGVGKSRVRPERRVATRPDAHGGGSSVAHAPRRRRRYNLELCTGGMWQYHGYVLTCLMGDATLGNCLRLRGEGA